MSAKMRIPASRVGPISNDRMAARFAYAAGATGILANLCLVALYVLLGHQGGSPEGGTLLGSAFHVAGSASDLLGSLAAALMIPVALALGGRLTRRRAVHFTQAAGLTAMLFLSVGGPLLVLGLLPFEVSTLNAVRSYMVLCLWLFLTNRWLLGSGSSWARAPSPGTWSSGLVSCCRGCRGRNSCCSAWAY